MNLNDLQYSLQPPEALRATVDTLKAGLKLLKRFLSNLSAMLVQASRYLPHSTGYTLTLT